jgi:hypothetical protein
MWKIEKNSTWYSINHSLHVCFEKKRPKFWKKIKFFLPHFNLDFGLGAIFFNNFSSFEQILETHHHLMLNPSLDGHLIPLWIGHNWCNIRKLGNIYIDLDYILAFIHTINFVLEFQLNRFIIWKWKTFNFFWEFLSFLVCMSIIIIHYFS